jgi:hypothetical protein
VPHEPSCPRQPDELSPAVLADFVTQLQQVLYQDETGHWDPDQSWDPDRLNRVSELFHTFGLAPVRSDLSPQPEEP